MRKSDFYGVDVPELGDRADITVVSQAIIDGENNQSGRVEHLEATNSGTTLILSSETRADKLIKYYNGLSVQFVSPVNINAGNSYNIKIDNLAKQPYNNKIDIKLGDVVVAIYGESGFVSYGTTLPRSSSVKSDSEVSIATSKSVKTAYDKGVEALNKANTKLDAGDVTEDYNTAEKIENIIKEIQENKADKTVKILAGNGLTGGGDLSSDKTFNVVSANDGIIVNKDNIQLNPVNGLSNSSTTRALAANQGLILDNKDKGIVGGYNGKFPLTSATKGNIYLLENTQKYYICITDYNGSKLTTPNANFEELSVYTNRSKLDNLFEIYTNGYEGYIKYSNGYCKQWGTIREMGTNHEVKLLIPLKDIYYNIQATYQAGPRPTTQSIGVSISIVSKEKIIVNKSQESSKFIAWTVEGFYK